MTKPDTPPAWCEKAAKEVRRRITSYIGQELYGATVEVEQLATLIAAHDPSAALRAAAKKARDILSTQPDRPRTLGYQARHILATALSATAAPTCARCERLKKGLRRMAEMPHDPPNPQPRGGRDWYAAALDTAIGNAKFLLADDEAGGEEKA